jgi:O-antigen/teichoic acid export membrane protein
MFVIGAFGTAYIPFMFSMHANEPERERALRAGILTYAAVVFVGTAVFLALFAREVAAVIAPGYDRAYQIVGILCIGVAAYGLSPITGAGINIARRTGYSLRYTVIALTGSVALCVILIPPIGLIGAAIGTASAYVALTLLYLRRSQILHPVDFHLGKVARIFLLGAVLMPVGLVDMGSIGLTLFIKALAAAAFVAALWPLGVIGEVENAELRRAIAAGRRRVASGGAG